MWLTDKKTILAVALLILAGETAFIMAINSGASPLWWHDIVLHFLGGALIAMIFLNLTGEFKDWWSYAGALQILISTAAFVFLIGVLWEFYEFSSMFLFKSIVLNLPDTLSDLFFDGLGGLFLSVAHVFSTKKDGPH